MITLIAEVSGFADIIFVTMAVLIQGFYTPLKLQSAMLENLVKLSQNKKKHKIDVEKKLDEK